MTAFLTEIRRFDMKVLSAMKKSIISVCAIVCGVSCWNIVATQNVAMQDN
jgi:hypothetical protein